MTTDTMLRDQLRAQWESFEDVIGAGLNGTTDSNGDEYESIMDAFDAEVLEVRVTYNITSGTPSSVHSFTLVVATGGPHVEVEIFDSNTATWSGWWSGDVETTDRYHDVYQSTFDMLAELFEV